MGGTHVSSIVYSAADVLGMSVVHGMRGVSVVHGMRGVSGVCEMCICLARAALEERVVCG